MLPPHRLLALAIAAVALSSRPGRAFAAAAADPGDRGAAVGSFDLAPAASWRGAYRNASLNTWGGALLHAPNDPKGYAYHMFASGFVGGQHFGLCSPVL